MSTSRRARLAAATAAVATLLLALPAASHALFCKPQQAPWLKRQLSSLPSVSSLPPRGRVPFASRILVVADGGSNNLAVDGDAVGYSFYSTLGRHRLGWRVALRLVRLFPARDREVALAYRKRRIGVLDPRRQSGEGRLVSIGVHVPDQRGFFRLDLYIRNRNNRLLGRYGKYLLGVDRYLDLRLDTDRPVYRPGETVRSEIENVGTQGIAFNSAYTIQREVDGEWVDVDSGGGPGLQALSGASIGGCERYRIPKGTPSGSYRIARRVDPGPLNDDTDITLTAPFRIE